MTLVVQREIACAEVAVRGEVEQDQPPEAGEENKTGIGDDGTLSLRGGRESLAQPGCCHQQAERRDQKPDHEVRGHGEEGSGFAAQHDRVASLERPGHATDPGRHRPCCDREGGADSGRAATPRNIEQHEAQSRPRRPLPASGMEQVAHRLVFCESERRRARVGHQCRRRHEGLPHVQPGTARRHGPRARKRRSRRRRRGCGMTVECSAEQQNCIGAQRVSPSAWLRCGVAKHALHRIECAAEGAGSVHRVAAHRVALEKRRYVCLRDVDGISQGQQLITTFLLLLAQLRSTSGCCLQRNEKRLGCTHACAFKRTRHVLDSLCRRIASDAPAQAVTHNALGKRGVRCAEFRQYGIRKPVHGQPLLGKAPVASGVVRGKNGEAREQRTNSGHDQARFKQQRPAQA